jgi:predicted site-specific integrase-resolvase
VTEKLLGGARSGFVTQTDEYVTTLIGYARVSKADGSQVHDLQRDALAAAGVAAEHVYEDSASGRRDKRPGSTLA